jgi:CDP-glucose 4,6-dehydratase
MGFRQSAVEGVDVNPQFWCGKRVLITGHTGFKGSWLALWLHRLGASVVGYSLSAPTNPSLFEIARVSEGIESITGNVRDLSHLAAVMEKARPQLVIHMAAEAIVRRSYAAPVETYATNVMGTVNLLEAIRLNLGPRAVIVVTSDKCYENKEWVWAYRENEALGGRDPYSSSKACAEMVTALYREAFFNGVPEDRYVAVATVRAGNVLGGGDWGQDRLIPDIMRSVQENRPVKIRNPNAIRPWQHVLEALDGYLILAERLWTDGRRFSEAWNFGPDPTASRSVRWVADRVQDLWGQGLRWEQDSGSHPREANSLHLDSTKARRMLGWAPRLTLEEALEKVVSWYRALAEDRDMRQVTLKQISAYEEIQKS